MNTNRDIQVRVESVWKWNQFNYRLWSFASINIHPHDILLQALSNGATCSVNERDYGWRTFQITITYKPVLPSNKSLCVALYACRSFCNCFSIFLLASRCAFSSMRWSSVLLLPKQPIFRRPNPSLRNRKKKYQMKPGMILWFKTRQE